MKAIWFIALLISALPAAAQQVPIMDIEQLKEHVYEDSDVTYIVNFWATWCAPCVKELPYFEALNAKYPDDVAKVVLVSLDFENALEKRVLPFLEKHNIQSEVIHMVEKRAPNYWIPEISDAWSGAIPATVIINGRQQVDAFFEQSFESLEELEELYLRLVY